MSMKAMIWNKKNLLLQLCTKLKTHLQLSHLDVELIWHVPSVECAVPVYKGLTFIKKWKWWPYNIFSFVCIFDGFLNFWGCFFVESLRNPVAIPELASINNKNPTILTKRPPVAITVPSGTQRHPWALVYRGIPSDLRSRPSNSTTFLGLCSPGDYRQSIESPMGVPPSTLQKRRSHSLFMIIFWEYGQKRCVIWRKLALRTSN